MTTPPPTPQPDDAVQALLQMLRRKENTWVEWGQACQQLQKSGYSPQQIFEETGFEPVQQNQLVVAAQVHQSIAAEITPEVQARFERTGSDTLYELRVLTQPERVAAATLIVEKGIDSEGAREVAKALKEFARFAKNPPEFADYPHDAIAHYYWKLARQQGDLQARSRLIAQGLRFARSESARQQIEKLLTDFTVTQSQSAPKLPFYRLESAAEQPRIVPVVGRLPLAVDDLQAVPLVESEEPFRLVQFAGTGAWIALPGWQVVFAAEDPVAILATGDQLPSEVTLAAEDVLILVDRAQRQWDMHSYFLSNREGQLQIDWFEAEPSVPLLGQVVLILRPKKVLDEAFNRELWQLDE